ncbi:folate-binding protein YgfZ [Myxococcus sp. AB025B]|uniref:CAF17-like 4Fe-4S cluster assembly/insertion protein YgfZ n=1 Tax=Myxococcus sp. AB025B TaxID=2562794 RepID=UPI0011437D92|nr:glycine cleavage T C-terminal barrel domain-containing protein [Myxococcus sp. AB025B]
MEPLSLHFLHEEARGRFLEVGGREVVADYGNAEDAYQAAREAVALHDASYREVLRITGEDRVTFLHGMVTQEVNNLPVGTAAYAALVNVKGAMVADARILKREADLLVDVEPGTGAKVREFLEKYLISEDAELHEATADHGLLRLLGPRTGALLTAVLGTDFAPLPHHATRPGTLAGQGVLLVGNTRLEPHGVDVWVPRAGLEAVWRALSQAGADLGLKPLGFETLELLRVEAGVPRYGQDMVDTTIPLEADLGPSAISYNKGCYIGQEVIARATFRGHMNRKLTGLFLGDVEAAPGTELRRGEKKVGWLTSVVRSPAQGGQRVALGYVHRDSLEPGTELTLAQGPETVKVAALPFKG